MHYKNGREAKNGDVVFYTPAYGIAAVGILYAAVAGNDCCNGRLAVPSSNDPYPNLAECVHIDDVVTTPQATVAMPLGGDGTKIA